MDYDAAVAHALTPGHVCIGVSAPTPEHRAAMKRPIRKVTGYFARLWNALLGR